MSQQHKGRRAARGIAALVASVFTLGTAGALAQTLPAPPVSPAPVTTYEYDAQGNPTKQTQAPGVTNFGFATSSTYDSLHRRKDTTDAKNGVTRFGYNGREDLTQVTDPRNLVTQYPRDGLGQATQLISPDTGTASHTYDAAGNIKTRTDNRGVLTTHSYDALNRLTQSVYSQGGQSATHSWTYDQSGAGFSNGKGRLTSSAHPGGSSRYAYDPQGRLTQQTQTINAAAGANPSPITLGVGYVYDAAGNLSGIVYPSGRQLQIGYAHGKPNSLSLAKDASSTASPLISQILHAPFGAPKGWLWHLAESTKAHERVYDSYGRLVRYRLGDLVRDLSYDAAGRITKYTHYHAPQGNASGAPQLSGSQADISGSVNLSSVGAVDWIKYDSSSATVQTKSSGGNQIQVQPLNSGDDFWNGDSSQTSVTHTWSDGSPSASGSSAAQGVMTSFANGAGLRLSFPASADLKRTVRIYWEAYSGQASIRAHLSDGSTSDLVYSETAPAGNLGGPLVTEFSYVAGSASQTLQVELVMEQGGGTVTLQAAAIVAATPVSATALGGSNAAISGNVNLSSVGAIDWIKYDSSTSTVQTKASGGNQIQVQALNGGDFWNGDTSQTAITHSWSDGSPTTSGSSSAQGVVTSFANGAGIRLTFPASAELQRTVRIYWEGYSAQTRVKAHLGDGSAADLVYSHTTPADALGGPQVAEFTYTAASANQTLQVDLVADQMLGGGGTVTLQAAAIVAASASTTGGTTVTARPELDQSFTYDALGRLTGIGTATANWSIGYDANGNRTGVTLNGTTSVYTTPATSNRLSSTTNPARSFGYDNAGNTTGDGSYSATYDLVGRLATLTKGGLTTTYTYSEAGQRVRKANTSGTVLFVYGQGGQLLGEYDSTGKAIREYVWLGGTPVAVFTPDPASSTNPPLVYFVHADHIDTPRVVLDRQGSLRWRWLAEPFGTTAPETNPANAGAFAMPLRFPGQYADAESGLSYNYFRDYDPSLGRYVQSDPIGLAGGINTYAYVESNPLLFSDPDGLQRKDPGSGAGPYHPPDGTSLRCTSADDCPRLKEKMEILKRMIASHEGWDRANPSPKGGNRHAEEIANLWGAYARCQEHWRKKDCDNCPPPKTFSEWLRDVMQPPTQYDPIQERVVPVPQPRPVIVPLPRLRNVAP